MEKDAKELALRLGNENIETKIDKIPYGSVNDPRFRVFVFGTDFQKVKKFNLEVKIF